VLAHLFDGTYELFRAWFGAPPAEHAGREVGATRAFIRSLSGGLRAGKVTPGGGAVDTVNESVRTREGLAPGARGEGAWGRALAWPGGRRGTTS